MKAFVSWSGGKDCMLALNRVITDNKIEVKALVNMCSPDGKHSGSHGIKSELIKQQASCLGLAIIQQAVDKKGYEHNFKQVISNLKNEGITAGIFGDIYLQAHRDWIDRVCAEMDITPVFPLWHNNTNLLLEEFIDVGFKTLVVSVNANSLSKEWLNRELNHDFLNEIKQLPGIDACAENGEYHSFVFDGPIFKKPLKLTTGDVRFENNHWLLELKNHNHV